MTTTTSTSYFTTITSTSSTPSTSSTTSFLFSPLLPQEFVARCETMKTDKESSAISHEVEVQFERFRSSS